MLGNQINIVDFCKLYPQAEFSDGVFYPENSLTPSSGDFNLVKVVLRIDDYEWFGIGYNLADANQTVINKASKFFRL